MVASTLVGIAFGSTMFALRWRLLPVAGGRRADGRVRRAVPRTGSFRRSACQFLLVGMGSALRGSGDLKIPTMIQIATVVINIVLAPVLMFGWGTGVALGVAGAALASFIAIRSAARAFVFYFHRKGSHLHFKPDQWSPEPDCGVAC